MSSCAKNLLLNWKLLIIIITPIIFLPLLFIESPVPLIEEDEGIQVNSTNRPPPAPSSQEFDTRFKCAYAIILIAIFWMTEALPLAITSLSPIVLFPCLGVLDTSLVTATYMKEASMMIIGGMIIATALEFSNLHLRIALKAMTLFGGSQARLLLGVMLISCVLSMWISNTATIVVMAPIVLAFVQEIETANLKLSKPTPTPTCNGNDNAITFYDEKDLEMAVKKSESYLRSKKMYLLAICYASKLGATGTITATASNLIFKEIIGRVDISQGGKYLPMNFPIWMAYNIPGVLINLLITWIYLSVTYLGISGVLSACWRRTNKSKSKPKSDNNNMEVLKLKYQQLGKMNFHEIAVGILFLTLIALWLTRDPGYIKGWGSLVTTKVKIGDSTAAILIVLALFIIPRNLPAVIQGKQASAGLLELAPVMANIPWSTVLLAGAGFTLSVAAESSGLSKWIGTQMKALEEIPPWVLLFLVLSVITLATEIISNSVCANLFLPILLTMSKRLNLHPLYLTIPATLSCNYAFMLPSASATSSITYGIGGGDLTIIDMIKHGVFVNFTCIVTTFILNSTYGAWLFSYNDYTYPETI